MSVNPPRRPDRGFSLVELLIVIVILGLLAAVTVFAVRGISDRGEENACTNDARTLWTAAEVYFTQQDAASIPATGAVDGDEYERTLVDAGLITQVSTYYELEADGTVLTSGDPCT